MEGLSYYPVLFSSDLNSSIIDENQLLSSLKSYEKGIVRDIMFTLSDLSFHDSSRFRLSKILSDDNGVKVESCGKMICENIAKPPTIVYLFPGQGSQYVQMGYTLFKHHAAFRDTIENGLSIAMKKHKLDLRNVLFQREFSSSINETKYAQPLLYIIEQACFNLLKQFGINANCVLGHSLGELSAAAAAGVFSFEEGLDLIVKRGELMQKMQKGKMLSVMASLKQCKKFIDELPKEKKSQFLTVSLMNSQKNCVLSGTNEDIEMMIDHLKEKEISCRVIKTSHAYHSGMMKPMVDELKSYIADNINLKIPNVELYTNSLANKHLLGDKECKDPVFWANQVINPVNFSGTIKEIAKTKGNNRVLFVEVGPSTVLTRLLSSNLESTKIQFHVSNIIRHPKHADNDEKFFLKCLCDAWMAGVKVIWKNLPVFKKAKKIKIPAEIIQVVKEKVPSKKEKKEESEDFLKVKQIWKSILGKSRKIFKNDNFFEVGGDSLSALAIAKKVSDVFDIYCELQDVFNNPTLLLFATRVDRILRSKQVLGARVIKKLEKRPTEAPLSFAQNRLFFIDKVTSEKDLYKVFVEFKIEGKINEELLEKCFGMIVKRHEIFRTVYISKDEGKNIVQKISEDLAEFRINIVDKENDVISSTFAGKEKRLPFILNQGPLLRIYLYRYSDTSYKLFMEFHHIVTDLTTNNIILRELSQLYNGFIKTGKFPELPEPYQYTDFSEWHRNFLTEERKNSQLDFWKKNLSAMTLVLDLPFDFPRKNKKTNKGETVTIKVDNESIKGARKYAVNNRTTMNVLFFSLFQILLKTYTREKNFVVGMSFANRHYKNADKICGFFVNVLPFFVSFNEKIDTVEDLVRKNQNTLLDIFENQDIPFEQIVSHCGFKRSLNVNPIFQVAYQFLDKRNAYSLDLINTKSQYIDPEINDSKFDLYLLIKETEEGLSLIFEYPTELFKKEKIEKIGNHFKNLVVDFSKNTGKSCDEYNMLSLEETSKIIFGFNSIKEIESFAPLERTVVSLFETVVANNGEKIACCIKNKSLTYNELNSRSNKVARYLLKLGVKPGMYVGLFMEKSIELIVSIIAIIKCGGVYFPIDFKLPRERLKFQIAETGCKFVITRSGYSMVFDSIKSVTQIPIDSTVSIVREKPENLEIQRSEDTPLYVIYTSGSTGKPKGITVLEKGLINYVYQNRRKMKITPLDRYANFASIAFDVSVSDIFTSLLTGITLVLIPEEIRTDTEKLVEYIKEMEISILHVSPSVVKLFKRKKIPCLRVMRVGGEACDESTMNFWSNNVPMFFNSYGPTEITISSSIKLWKEGDSPRNIGNPFPNVKYYVLNEKMKPVPVGVVGELYVGGVGVAKGYLNRPEMTSQKFLSNPFESGRMYKTGDLCCFNENGDIIFHGRVDFQVKLRGFRIELGDIEGALRNNELVKDCIVLCIENQTGNKQLVSFIILKEKTEKKQNVREILRSHLSGKVPHYMIPSLFVVLDEFPLNISGKIDRAELKKRSNQASESSNNLFLPKSEFEDIVLNIWKNVLKVGDIGKDDDFFEIGGHSLLATFLIREIQKRLKIPITIRSLFENPTIDSFVKSVSEMMTTSPGRVGLNIKKVPVRALNIALSAAQQRLLFMERITTDKRVYMIPLVFEIKGKVNIEALNKALNYVIKKHEALRTIFVIKDNIPYQFIRMNEEAWRVSTQEYDGMNEKDFNKYMNSIIEKELMKDFDLSKGPLVRCCVIHKNENIDILSFCIHHIVSDMTSNAILMRELSEEYNRIINKREEKKKEEEQLQYVDFSEFHTKILKDGRLLKQLKIWENMLTEIPKFLNIPTDYPRSRDKTNSGSSFSFTLKRELFEKVREITIKEGVTLSTAFLTFYQILLYKYSSQANFTVGMPFSNRHYLNSEKILGFFVNVLPFPIEIKESNNFLELFQKNKETLMDVFENQDVPFENIVSHLNISRTSTQNPLFQVVYQFINRREIDNLQLDGLEIKPISYDVPIAKFDMQFEVFEPHLKDDDCKVVIKYSTGLFKEKTMDRIKNDYTSIIEKAVKNSTQNVGSICLLDQNNINLVVKEWNKTEKVYPFTHDKNTFVEMFESCVNKHGNKECLYFEKKVLTYDYVNKVVNRIARFLREKLKVKHEEFVGVCVSKSLESVIFMLAVMKSGGVYFPLDPKYPVDRLKMMFEETDCKLILSEEQHRKRFSFFTGSFFSKDDVYNQSNDYSNINLERIATPKSLLYVIYTSGSTGRPKGVQIQNGGLVNFVQAHFEHLDLMAGDKFCYLFASIFDGHIAEVLPTIVNGLCLVIVPEETRVDAIKLYTLMKEANVNGVIIAPSLLKVLPYKERELNLKTLIVAGEACDLETMLLWKSRVKHFINAYGPTEVTVCSHMGEWEPKYGATCIGNLLRNVKGYILDDGLQPVAVGSPGELFIGGVGLARGYLKRPDLTAERFVDNPFRKGEKMYKTGDLCKYLPTGEVIFISRKDFQVKINGFRIELEEIEKVIRKHRSIKDVVVLVITNPEGKRLVAYLIRKSEEKKNYQRKSALKKNLIRYLSSRLPHYMIPSGYVFLKEFPLSFSGKVDRNVLKTMPVKTTLSSEYAPPRKKVQQILCKIWSRILSEEKVGIDDNFFELGGESIRIIQMVSECRSRNIVFDAKTVYDNPTIRKLSRKVKRLTPQMMKDITIQDVNPMQGWFFSQKTNKNHNNISLIATLDPKVDLENLLFYFTKLFKFNDALRIKFNKVGGKWFQVLEKYPQFDIASVFVHKKIGKIKNMRRVLRRLHKSLSISHGRLLKVCIFELPTEVKIILIGHKLVVDESTLRIMLEHVEKYHNDEEDAVNETQKSLSLKWKSTFVTLEKEELYWKTHVSKTDTMVADFENGPNIFNQKVVFELSEKESELFLNRGGKYCRASNKEMTISALFLAFKNFSQLHKIRFFLNENFRDGIDDDSDSTSILGNFMSNYPVSFTAYNFENVEKAVIYVKRKLRAVPNGGFGYQMLKYKLGAIVEPVIVINFEEETEEEENESTLFREIKKIAESAGHTTFQNWDRDTILLTIKATYFDGKLKFNFEYSDARFDILTIERLVEHLKEQVKTILDEVGKKKEKIVTTSEIGSKFLAEIRSMVDRPFSLIIPELQHVSPINPEGTKNPLFVIHDIFGGSSQYMKLSNLYPELPMYGINFKHFMNENKNFKSLREMAVEYIKWIKIIQPNGPYVLGGYSFGGLVAFEMACLLEKMGEKVDRLVIFDTFLREEDEIPKEEEFVKGIFTRFGFPLNGKNHDINLFKEAIKKLFKLLREYKPEMIFQGKVVVFRASESVVPLLEKCKKMNDIAYSFLFRLSKFITHVPSCYVVDTNHWQMLVDINSLKSIASNLKFELERESFHFQRDHIVIKTIMRIVSEENKMEEEGGDQEDKKE